VPTVAHRTLLYGVGMIRETISAMHVVSAPFFPIWLSARRPVTKISHRRLSFYLIKKNPIYPLPRLICTLDFSLGLYYKLHGTHRPEAMKKTVIKRRRRVPANNPAGAPATPGQGHHQSSSSSPRSALRPRSPVSAIPHHLNLEQQAAEALVAVGRSSPALPHPYSQQAAHHSSSHVATTPSSSSSFTMSGHGSSHPSQQQRMDESGDYSSPHRMLEMEHEHNARSTPPVDEPRPKRPRRGTTKKDTPQEQGTSYGGGASSTAYSHHHHSQQYSRRDYPHSQQQYPPSSQGEQRYGAERDTEVDELSGDEGSGSIRSTSSHSHRSFSGPNPGISISSATGGPGASAGGRGGTPLRRLPELNMVFPDRPQSAASNASFAGGRVPSRASTVGPSAPGVSGGDLPSIDSYMRTAHSGTPTPRVTSGVSSSSPPSTQQLDRIPTRAEMERHYALMRDERQRLVEMLGTTDRMLASIQRALNVTASEEGGGGAGGGASTSVPLRRSSGDTGKGSGGSGSLWAFSAGGESSS